MLPIEKKYQLGFPISADLYNRLNMFIQQINASTDKKKHIPVMLNLVDELVDNGMEYFFHYPADLAKLNIISRNAVNFSINTAKKGVIPIVHRVIKSLNDKELMDIIGFLKETIEKSNPTLNSDNA